MAIYSFPAAERRPLDRAAKRVRLPSRPKGGYDAKRCYQVVNLYLAYFTLATRHGMVEAQNTHKGGRQRLPTS